MAEDPMTEVPQDPQETTPPTDLEKVKAEMMAETEKLLAAAKVQADKDADRRVTNALEKQRQKLENPMSADEELKAKYQELEERQKQSEAKAAEMENKTKVLQALSEKGIDASAVDLLDLNKEPAEQIKKLVAFTENLKKDAAAQALKTARTSSAPPAANEPGTGGAAPDYFDVQFGG